MFRHRVPRHSFAVTEMGSVLLMEETVTEKTPELPLNAKLGLAAGAFIGPVAWAATPMSITNTITNAKICFRIEITSLRFVFHP